MPPRKTTDFGALFESLVDDLRIQVAASVDQTIADLGRRISRIERRLDQLDPDNASTKDEAPKRVCSLCERSAVARGMCSAHYQQWRYRERKRNLAQRVGATEPTTTIPTSAKAAKVPTTVDPAVLESALLINPKHEISADN